MKLEHLNLVVKDIHSMINFYKSAFPHWYVRAKGKSDWYGVERNWVHFGDDFQYLTFNSNGQGENRDLEGHETGLAHFAYVVSNLESVNNRLLETGFKPRASSENKYRKNIYFIDPRGYEVEFVEYYSDIPVERNSDQ
ncbi:glyoxalase [Francisella halioticida]|uniref:Glyoxalase n=1 Tax=Francisella halioticida TaxID=549298 RepID=A0ABM6M0B3_9GAMM|nr:VOC family protein [Francisella halioticida]ASG68384.1 glyoxalase [Francisella halioticida]BCD91249.1 glyoxalase [Francisella halioticida]